MSLPIFLVALIGSAILAIFTARIAAGWILNKYGTELLSFCDRHKNHILMALFLSPTHSKCNQDNRKDNNEQYDNTNQTLKQGNSNSTHGNTLSRKP